MNDQDRKCYAAVCYALGRTRGMLSNVLDGEIDLDRVREVLDASAGANIAKAIGLSEAEMPFPDWHGCLTIDEQWIISGRDGNNR